MHEKPLVQEWEFPHGVIGRVVVSNVRGPGFETCLSALENLHTPSDIHTKDNTLKGNDSDDNNVIKKVALIN